LTSDRVVVFAPNWLGDAVMALPAIADLRRHFQAAQFVVAARASVASLFELVPGVDEIVTLRRRSRDDLATLRRICNATPGVGSQIAPSTAEAGIAVLFPNSFAIAWLAKQASFHERWGYARDWRTRLLTRSVKVPRVSMHQGRYYQHLVGELGVATGPLAPHVDVSEGVRDQARELLITAGWDAHQSLVTMAPGAAYGTAKRWLPAHFARVVGELARVGVRTALIGSSADAETIRTIVTAESARDARPIELAGKTSLQELAGVIALSGACVSNDSGAMHLAGAIGTPIIALFGPTRESETAPLTRATVQGDMGPPSQSGEDLGRPSRSRAAEVLVNPVWCRPCMLRECPIDHRCMKGLEPSRVIASLKAILE
jgi:heptosyltransferase II